MSAPSIADLVAWWALNEASGGRLDSHINGLDLTDNNTVGSIAGKQSNAALFVSANSERLTHVDDPLLRLGDNDWTIAGWFRHDVGATFQVFLGKQSVSLEYRIVVTSGDAFRLQCSEDGAVYKSATDGTSVAVGAWYFVVGYHDATANEFGVSVNGGSFTTTALAQQFAGSTDDFAIGSRGDTASYVDGAADEVSIWGKVLSQAEIDWLYNSGAGRSYRDVAGWLESSVQVSPAMNL